MSKVIHPPTPPKVPPEERFNELHHKLQRNHLFLIELNLIYLYSTFISAFFFLPKLDKIERCQVTLLGHLYCDSLGLIPILILIKTIIDNI